MDLSFISDIFKHANFNTLMFSTAIAGWIMFYNQIDSLLFGLACLASVYCITRFIVFCYKRFRRVRNIKKASKQKQLAKEQKEKRYEENRKIEILRMFDGLSDSNKFTLASILLKGEKDKYENNVLYFQKESKDVVDLYTARSITGIYIDRSGNGQACIEIRDYYDRVAAIIDPCLYNLIKQHIENNKAK